MNPQTATAVALNIDGRPLTATAGETVLDVARREGISIPALCHQPGMPAWGGCRLCLVDVEGMDKLQAACTTLVREGMAVMTDTGRVRRRRESYLKMYLSDHNAYCEAPCVHACPAHIDIPAYIEALAAGDAARAAEIVRREMPFPGILGRICPRYCEPVCRRGEVDEPIAICALHRAAADGEAAESSVADGDRAENGAAGGSVAEVRLAAGEPTGKRVAVVGAGPAGLTAAWYLTECGHQVTVYDENEEPGGLLRYVIPEFRLPAEVVARELRPLWEAGVRFVGNCSLGYEVDVGDLFQAGFDAVIVSVGAPAPAAPVLEYQLPGSETALRGFDVLQQVRRGEPVDFGDSVVVVGGGNAALDLARTARRLGTRSVTVLAPAARAAMIGFEHVIRAAEEEGVGFAFGETATRVIAREGLMSAVECESQSTVEAETIIIALEATPGGGAGLWADSHTGRTDDPGVFAAGDSVGDALSGGPSVINAVAGGKRTAFAVDAWLRGEDLQALEVGLEAVENLPYLEQLVEVRRLGPLAERLVRRDPYWLKMGIAADPSARATMPVAPPAERLQSPEMEVEKGLDLEAAREEAARCLQCVCPSLGDCELQRLGVEYAVSSNHLVAPGSRVRALEPQHEHPFIRRDMARCIACGRCVRICRDIAGPACYEFTGRGLATNIDTAYGQALELADCITCGRCVTVCPTGALTFNERTLASFRIDESRCILCRECVNVCPVDAICETNHFEDARLKWLELIAQGSGLAGGHRMCAGCGAPIVVRQVLMGTSDPVVVSAATGCLEVSTTIYPYTSWKGSYIHTAFENAAATLSGVETAFRALKKKGAIDENVKFIAFGGDGGTYDIGFQSLSGAMERGHRMLYVCYDNGAYMNTGFQRSSATPMAAWTTTSPVGEETAGKLQHRKNLTEIMVAHGIAYVAQASPHDPRDLVRKAAKALAVDGPTFLNVIAPCPRGWRSEGAESIDLAREAVNTCYWPLFEVVDGRHRLTYRPRCKQPLAPWLKRQGRFAHLFKPGSEDLLARVEAWVDSEWEKLLRRCGEPSEAEWQAADRENGCLPE